VFHGWHYTIMDSNNRITQCHTMLNDTVAYIRNQALHCD
jgi:hypothetical protein